MQIKNKQVAGIIAALSELVQMKVNVRTGMKIRKLARVIEQQATDMEAERQRLIELYARRDEAGQRLVKEDHSVAVDDEFFDKFAELLELEFEAPEPLTVDELEEVGEMAPAVLIGLGDLLVE